MEPFSGLPLESWCESVVWSDALTRLAIVHKKSRCHIREQEMNEKDILRMLGRNSS